MFRFNSDSNALLTAPLFLRSQCPTTKAWTLTGFISSLAGPCVRWPPHSPPMQHLACQIQEVASAWQDSTHPLYGKPLYKGELWLPENTRWRRAHRQRRLRRGWILVPISVFNSRSCTCLTIHNLVVLNDRTWIIQSRRWWQWGSSKSVWSTDTKWSRGVTWRAWHCFRGN